MFGALRITNIQVCLGVRGEDPAAAARNYGKLQAWLYPVLGVLDRFIYLQFDELRIVPDFGSAEPTVEDRVSLPGDRAGAVYRRRSGAGADGVLAQKSAGHFPYNCGTLNKIG